MKSDHWTYGLFRECPTLMFRWMGAPESEAADYRFDAVELKQMAARLDGVFCPKRPQGTYYFLEVQLYKDADFYRTWMVKIMLCCRQYRIANWRALAVFGSRRHEPKRSTEIVEWIASGRIVPVYLNELPEYPEIPLEVAVLKLARASRKSLLPKACALAAAAKAPKTDVQKPDELLAIIETIVVSNFPRLTRAEFQVMFQLDDIRKSRIFKEVRQEAIQEGERKGERKGKREGKREGERKGKREGQLAERKATVARLHAKGQSIAEICDLLDLDEEFVQKALASMPRDS